MILSINFLKNWRVILLVSGILLIIWSYILTVFLAPDPLAESGLFLCLPDPLKLGTVGMQFAFLGILFIIFAFIFLFAQIISILILKVSNKISNKSNNYKE